MASHLQSLLDWKRSLALPSPGTFESLHREARNVSLTSLGFEGGKADLAKGLSPSFQVSHSFTLGSPVIPPTYHFASIFVSGKHLLHGMIDTNGVFQGKYHHQLAPSLTAKVQSQIASAPGQSMLQAELDYTGGDHSLNVKAINPDIADGATGIYTASIMQSVSKALAVGIEAIVQRMPDSTLRRKTVQDVGFNLAGKLALSPAGILTVNLQPLAAVQASYYHRVSDKVDLATEFQAVLAGPRTDAVTTVGARFDYRQAVIRAQADTAGKVGLLYEERLFPGFSLLLSGELDHAKGDSRWGVGVNLEN